MMHSACRNLSTHFHWTLPTLTLAVLLSLAAALNCVIDLSQIGQFNTAKCDSGCDSCNFTLENAKFQFGTVECLSQVPCWLKVATNKFTAMKQTTVDGTVASALSVQTSGSAHAIWRDAVFLAPANRGNFRFETCTSGGLDNTTFYANGAGVVDIIINEDGRDAVCPELWYMYVFASTAEALNIVFGNGSRFAGASDSESNSRIECPMSGACLWQSSGLRYPVFELQSVVKLVVKPTTALQLICANYAEACDGVEVYCNNEANSCQMQYSAEEWVCNGTCAGYFNPTTTLLPVAATTRMVTTTHTPVATEGNSDEPKNDGSSQTGKLVLYVLVGGFCVALCFCSVAVAYLLGQNQSYKAQVSEASERQTTASNERENVSVDIRLIVEQPTATVLPEHTQKCIEEHIEEECVEMEGCRDRRLTDFLIAEQPEGVEATELEAILTDRRQPQQHTKGPTKRPRPPPPPRKQAIDYKDEDELLYVDMGSNTVGQTE